MAHPQWQGGGSLPASSGLAALGLMGTRAGAHTGPALPAADLVAPTSAADHALVQIARRLGKEDEAQGAARGTLASIGKVEEQMVFLLRACDMLTVQLCPMVVGKELLHELRSAGENARPLLRTLRFPVNITDGIAYGMAAMQWGGRDHASMPDYSIGAANFPRTDEEAFDSWRAPRAFKIEARPRHATQVGEWYRDALRESWAWACVYGSEHYAEQAAAALQLLELHEKHKHQWPAHIIFGVWAELRRRYCEEIRMLRRQLLRAMGEDSPSFERVRFFATAPDSEGKPFLQLPTVYQLDDPQGYFVTDVRARHDALLMRSAWEAAFRGSRLTPGKAGEEARGEGASLAETGPGGTKAGAGARPAATAPPSPGGGTSLLGAPLTSVEQGRSLDHRPRSPGGKYICWDAGCHQGCSRPGCTLSHKPMPAAKALDYTIQLQCIRRRGLKSGKKVATNEEAERLLAGLRAAQAAETAEKKADGPRKKGGRPGGRAGQQPNGPEAGPPPSPPTPPLAPAAERPLPGPLEAAGSRGGELAPLPWAPPEELQELRPTDLEEDLRVLLQGPDFSWMKPDDEAAGLLREDAPPADPAEGERRTAMQAVDAGEHSEILRRQPALLGVYLRNRLRRGHEKGEPVTLAGLAQEAAEFGCPELAEQASSFLEQHLPPPEPSRAGQRPEERASVGAVTWTGPGSPGRGTLEWLGMRWEMEDHRDRLQLDEELEHKLLGAAHAPQEPEMELRQCLFLNVAGALLRAGSRKMPKPAAIQDLAHRMRAQMHLQALEALQALGPAPPHMSAAEADLRVFCHDAVYRDHDKDYRALLAFPLEDLEPYALHVVRIDFHGQATVNSVTGIRWSDREQSHLWVMIHRGHMRALRPPEGTTANAALTACASLQGAQALAAGWEAHLAQAEESLGVAAKFLEDCPHCKAVAEGACPWTRRCASGAFGSWPLALLETGARAGREQRGRSLVALEGRPAVRQGAADSVTLQELKEWLGPQADRLGKPLDLVEEYTGEARIAASVEEAGGSALRLGLAHGQDFRRRRDRELSLALNRVAKPRHRFTSPPCTAFSTLTYLNEAQGRDLSAVRAEGEVFFEHAQRGMLDLADRGGAAHLEHPWFARSWALLLAALQEPPWQKVRLDQCCTGQGNEHGLHLKPTGILTNDPNMAAAMSLRCPGGHDHQPVCGSSTKATETYTWDMARRIAAVVMKEPQGAPPRCGELCGGRGESEAPPPPISAAPAQSWRRRSRGSCRRSRRIVPRVPRGAPAVRAGAAGAPCAARHGPPRAGRRLESGRRGAPRGVAEQPRQPPGWGLGPQDGRAHPAPPLGLPQARRRGGSARPVPGTGSRAEVPGPRLRPRPRQGGAGGHVGRCGQGPPPPLRQPRGFLAGRGARPHGPSGEDEPGPDGQWQGPPHLGWPDPERSLPQGGSPSGRPAPPPRARQGDPVVAAAPPRRPRPHGQAGRGRGLQMAHAPPGRRLHLRHRAQRGGGPVAHSHGGPLPGHGFRLVRGAGGVDGLGLGAQTVSWELAAELAVLERRGGLPQLLPHG